MKSSESTLLLRNAPAPVDVLLQSPEVDSDVHQKVDLDRDLPVIFIAHPSDLLTDHLPNGDGLVAYGFISELLRRGYRLHVATRGTALRNDLPKNATLYPVQRRFRSEMLDRLNYMWTTRRILRRLRKVERIDLIHQMNPVFAGLSLGLLGCGLPVVLGTYVARWPGGELRDEDRSALQIMFLAAGRWMINLTHQAQATALLVTTPAAMNRIPLPVLSRRKSHVIRHGINADMFAPEPGWQEVARTRVPTILFYAHLDRRKGIFVLIDAFGAVLRSIPEARLIIVGRGDHAEEVYEHVRNCGYGSRVEIRGRLEREDAPALLRDCSVYCLPSFGEPYGMTLLEAMACARPVVVTKAGGLPYVMAERGGISVPPGDATALADALISILRSVDRQIAMGAENRAFVEQHFTWEKVADDLEEVYRQLTHRVKLKSVQKRAS